MPTSLYSTNGRFPKSPKLSPVSLIVNYHEVFRQRILTGLLVRLYRVRHLKRLQWGLCFQPILV